MERYRGRLVLGTALMAVGFAAELVMLSGLVLPQRPPAWFWSLLLLIGVGGCVIISAFVASGRDRREGTKALLEGDDPPRSRR